MKEQLASSRPSSKRPVLPITRWGDFPSAIIPSTFNYGQIYHHIIESVQNIKFNEQVKVTESDHSDDEQGTSGQGTDLHTAKPLRKGKLFFTSGHVQNIKDCKSKCDNFYFLKSKVLASMRKDVKYDVTCTLSTSSGFIVDASCNCKASAMGRCNHICALLFALLDYTEKHGTNPAASTSQTCSWNKGRK